MSRYDLNGGGGSSDSSRNIYPKLLKYHNFQHRDPSPPPPPTLPSERNRYLPERSSSLGSSDSGGSNKSVSTGNGSKARVYSNDSPNYYDSYSNGSYESGGSSASSKYSLLNQYRSSRPGSDEFWRPLSYETRASIGGSGGGSSSSHIRISSSTRGLLNFGNFCFINCAIQCLSHTRMLMEYFFGDTFVRDRNNGRNSGLTESLAALINNLWDHDASSKGPVNCLEFRKQIRRFSPRFDGSVQQDAQEFLRYLLLGVHDEVNRANAESRGAAASTSSSPTSGHLSSSRIGVTSSKEDNYHSVFFAAETSQAEAAWKSYSAFENSVVVDLFVGQLRSTLTCTVCGHNSITFDPFWDLSLPLPSGKRAPNLYHCFDIFMEEEFLDGGERPRCLRCDAKRKCSKRFSVQKFPKVLVLHLKRFSSHGNLGSKINAAVDYPVTDLDLTRFCSRGTVNRSSEAPLYDLYAVIDHSGYAGAGHYTAKCRHPYSGVWYDFNDASVTPIDTTEIVSSNAYILFYEQSVPSSKL